jgi:hypothetical protein
MNMLSAIIGCVWLAIIGEWYFIGFGALLIIASPYLLSILMLPGLAISTLANSWQERNNFLFYALGYLSKLYANALIVGWCFFSFNWCVSLYGYDLGEFEISFGVIPYLLWSWSIALTPWQTLAGREPDISYKSTMVFITQVLYLLLILSTIFINQIPHYFFIIILSVLFVYIALPITEMYDLYIHNAILKDRDSTMNLFPYKSLKLFSGKNYSIFLLSVLIFIIGFELYVGLNRGYFTTDRALSIAIAFYLNLTRIPFWKKYFKI